MRLGVSINVSVDMKQPNIFLGENDLKTINYQGKQIGVEELDILNSNERWNEYQLSDGAELATKTVLVRVFKAKTEKNPDGEPLYIINSQNIVKAKTVN